MKVELLHHTPLFVCSTAIRKCWASEDKSDTVWITEEEDEEGGILFREPFDDWLDTLKIGLTNVDYITGKKDKELIARVGNKNKHKSTLEHLVYTFDIDGISRGCLQEVARHRMASYSVKSTRYTLKELKDVEKVIVSDWCVLPYIEGGCQAYILETIRNNLCNIQFALQEGMSNDKAKYMLPESFKTSLVMTINARSLQNFLELRSSKAALWEIQELAKALFEAIPDEHKYLFKEYMNECN